LNRYDKCCRNPVGVTNFARKSCVFGDGGQLLEREAGRPTPRAIILRQPIESVFLGFHSSINEGTTLKQNHYYFARGLEGGVLVTGASGNRA
jgi:hypothetical protein